MEMDRLAVRPSDNNGWGRVTGEWPYISHIDGESSYCSTLHSATIPMPSSTQDIDKIWDARYKIPIPHHDP